MPTKQLKMRSFCAQEQARPKAQSVSLHWQDDVGPVQFGRHCCRGIQLYATQRCQQHDALSKNRSEELTNMEAIKTTRAKTKPKPGSLEGSMLPRHSLRKVLRVADPLVQL